MGRSWGDGWSRGSGGLKSGGLGMVRMYVSRRWWRSMGGCGAWVGRSMEGEVWDDGGLWGEEWFQR